MIFPVQAAVDHAFDHAFDHVAKGFSFLGKFMGRCLLLP